MNLKRMILLTANLAVGLSVGGSVSVALGAEEYPTKPITVIVPFPPGGSTDTIARPFASLAQQHLGQPMVILNKAGGGGAVGTQFVAQAKPDGYTLLYTLNQIIELPHVDELLGRVPAFRKDQFIPIGQVTASPIAIMVNADSPWKSFKDLVAAAKPKADGFMYASAGVNSTTHIMWERIFGATGVRLRHFPTTGGGPVMTAVLGNNVDVGHCGVPSVCDPQVAAGKVRLLAITSAKRHPAYPDVPTLRELGYDVVHLSWHALMVPAGTPPEIVAKLRKGMKAIVDSATFKAQLDKMGERVDYLSGEDFERFWDAEYTQIGEVLKRIVKK